MSSTEIMMNSDKVLLTKYIMSIEDAETLSAVKNRLSIFFHIGSSVSEKSRTDKVLEAISRGWEDDNSAECEDR